MATSTKAKAKVTKKAVKKPAAAAKRATPKKKAASVTTQSNFFEARFTDQSLYWIIFGVAAIVFALWLFMLDAKVRDLYDQVDANTYNMNSTVESNASKDME